MSLKMIAENFNNNSIFNFLSSIAFPKYNLFHGISQNDVCNHHLELLENSFRNGKLFISESEREIEAIASFRILEWDSIHFGFRCAVIDQYYFNQKLDDQKLTEIFEIIFSEILAYAKTENVHFISMSVSSWDTCISNILQVKKFRYILTWLDGINIPSGTLSVLFPEHEFGLIKESEITAYQKIAENQYFEGGRFYLDKNFPVERVKKMYSELVLSSYKNDDIMLSYRVDGEPSGLFVSKKIHKFGNQNSIRIAPLRFLVIRNDMRTQNIGKDLFSRTLNFLLDKCDVITTGLEAHNLSSLNLHSKLNFKFNYTHNMFHWWAKES